MENCCGIHTNANKNRKVQGFETFVKARESEDAIEVASREFCNKLEEFTDRYEELTGEALIMATMAQSMFMKESEDLASISKWSWIRNLTPQIAVKQAGFTF